MRTTILLISLIFCSLCHAYSQGFIVSYKETATIAPSADLSQIDNPQIRAAIESSRRDMARQMIKITQLLVTKSESVYTIQEIKEPDSKTIATGSGNIVSNIRFSSASPHTIYKNHRNKQMTAQANFDEKEYLIEDSLTELKWKIGKKTREVSGYPCIEATTKTATGANVTAWYAPDIPISDGPSSYWGLPGLILYLDINSGESILSCTSIEQINDLPVITAPVEGEKVSRAQYNQMVTEKNQALNEQNSGRRGTSTVIIR